MATRLSGIWKWLRTSGAGVGLEVLVNGVLPYLIYTLTQAQLGDVKALIASSGPPILWSLLEFVRHRRVDAISLLVLAGIAFSLLAVLGGGGAKFLQLRENLVTGAIGLLFLGSAAIRRPLFWYLARAGMSRNPPAEGPSFEQIKDAPLFRRAMMVMTLVWGVVLIARTAVSVVLVFTLSIPNYLIAHPIVGYASMGGVGLWTVWYTGRQQRLGKAERAAREAREAAEAAAASKAEPAAATRAP
jgi:hypothetical protein